MTRVTRLLVSGAIAWLVPLAPALAQQPDPDTRPATTTFLGDTGLWFVPTGEILPAGRWSGSGYRVNLDRQQGFTDISHFLVSVGYGIANRVELFGSWRIDTRIDRDVRPLFTGDLDAGGLVNEYPFVATTWTGDSLGDLYVGAKVNLLSEGFDHPLALAVRGMIKLPTGSDTDGVGTGKADFLVDGILSKEVNRAVELAGFGGLVWRGQPDGLEISHGIRWGFGAGFPSRSRLRVIAELHGEIPFDDLVVDNSAQVAVDGSVSPFLSTLQRAVDANIGLTWQGRSGVFAGVGLSWAIPHEGRSLFGDFEDEPGDSLGVQLRLGYHPGVRTFAPIPPAPLPLPPPPVPANLPPTVRAQCNPCTVLICESSTVTADASDPDGDPLTYRWTAPSGAFSRPTDRTTVWTAPCEPGPVPITVTVDDGKGGLASDTVTIQVIRPAEREFVFEDVHFDFDRYSLRPDAARTLDEAIRALQANPTLRLIIEGHTCNIGTAEYNLALGERRAISVRDYLTARGVNPNRLQTVSYGEERPKHDNSREETRRLNRRAAMVVRLE
jgi:outer membrane protein OmpA-like peptidoglycan-associated protein